MEVKTIRNPLSASPQQTQDTSSTFFIRKGQSTSDKSRRLFYHLGCVRINQTNQLHPIHHYKMPVTELLFPQYKQGLKTLAGLKENGPKIFATFKGVEGLQSGFRGRLLEENGNPIDPSAMRSVLILGKKALVISAHLIITHSIIRMGKGIAFP